MIFISIASTIRTVTVKSLRYYDEGSMNKCTCTYDEFYKMIKKLFKHWKDLLCMSNEERMSNVAYPSQDICILGFL